ncbi:undecaprenyldiphospho-muramoylpentapeptide beta-N-acetylglucosaminyltransferase [Marinobacter halodurans]|uniref:UDP-N-acetylglucosamine--N-acetylmuramyl-(pentapeptide) pyrophosphoryl-undecaprenol N-acetylglucosamine transferase n=1 Tax=Marinobacter halodurans TaxID=2528979 RepID=A0ABY1ZNE2_9GAMM|nr:undecaprenyldiphospho-muramoylpentapeptide beta-N-acetylglucosaminyltransferase [Marinobacter halodurans]TBW56254.1 undecaprenyldiphospho-muramoylpentapeptide beta-N-acetylglucosaminyltransferase [Marinobacter halodurans]
MTTRRFLIMAGGTGGHVFPALATARHLQEQGHEVYWLGSRGGMEERLIGETGIPMATITVSGLRGKGRLALLLAPFRLARALIQALGVMRRIKPHCVIGMGGFVTGPGGVAAWLTRTPLLVHEQNAIAGMTNRILARFAETVMEAFPGSFGQAVVTRYTGNPVRGDLATMAAPAARFAERSGPVRLLVLGGSLGAQAINTTLPRALALMPEDQRPTVRHQCGTRNLEATEAAYEEAGVTAKLEPFISDMAEAYNWADIVLCRAGALTIAELCAVGLGAILVPFPHAVDDHQTRNGQQMVQAGAAILIPQSKLTDNVLAETLSTLCSDREKVAALADAARSLARADATERVVNYCLEAAHG